MLVSGQKITAQNTLIVFYEIQDCPNVINSLKYFCENGSEYHIACAGSLLGITLAQPSSFPVGKVDYLQINPMTFTEFLMANGDDNLMKYLESVTAAEPIPDAFIAAVFAVLFQVPKNRNGVVNTFSNTSIRLLSTATSSLCVSFISEMFDSYLPTRSMVS